MTIKHLVFSGGSYKILHMIGIIKRLKQINYYKLDDIPIYVRHRKGIILSLLVMLDLDLTIVEDFIIINKPWEKTLKITTETILNIIYKKGFLNIEFMYNIFANHFKHKNIKLNITLKELYEYIKIEFNIYVFNISKFESEIFNYKTHPDLKVVEAIYMSCSIPFAFRSMKYNGNYYLDGGLEIEYPLNDTVDICENTKEILGIRVSNISENIKMSDDINILSYGIYLFERLIHKHRKLDYKKIDYEII